MHICIEMLVIQVTEKPFTRYIEVKIPTVNIESVSVYRTTATKEDPSAKSFYPASSARENQKEYSRYIYSQQQHSNKCECTTEQQKVYLYQQNLIVQKSILSVFFPSLWL